LTQIHYYFAYGSNMNPERVAARGLGFSQVAGARLDGVALVFNKQSRDHPGQGHANLVRSDSAGSSCRFAEGVLYRLSRPEEIRRMDRFENAPVNYSRDVVRVETSSGLVSAWSYFANPAVQVAGLRPTSGYMQHLLAGAPYLSTDYVTWLREHLCHPSEQSSEVTLR